VSVTDELTEAPAADGRSTRWDDHTAERRQRILDAATDLIQDAGDAVSVRDIADRAGVPRSVVYRIFRDRDDLDEQIRAVIVARLMTVVAPTLEPNGTIYVATNKAISTYVDWVSRNPRLHQFLGAGSAKRPTTGPRVGTGSRSAIARQMTSFLQQAAKKAGGDPTVAEPLAYGVVGLIDGAVNRWVNNPKTGVPADLVSRFLADSAWAILKSEASMMGISLTRRTRFIDVL
jgi:AcrR family transcriptional regulator